MGLALSGGGARGVAHIGVIAALEEAGIMPDLVAGTSAGSLVGAFFLAGWDSHQMLEEVKGLTWRDLVRIRVPDLLGLIDGNVIQDALTKRIGDLQIEDLPVPYAAVAADLLSQETVTFRSGPLASAVRASCSIPGIFTPHLDAQGRMLVDGGVLDNLPAEVAREMGADLVLAVNVSAAAGQPERLPKNVFEVLEYAFTLQQATTLYRGRDPDWLVTPQIPPFLAVEVANRADDLFQVGYEAAQAVIPEIVKEWRPVLSLPLERGGG